MILKIEKKLGLKLLMEEYCKKVVERGEVNNDKTTADDKFMDTPG